LIPLVWVLSALAVYFPSKYFPYERAMQIELAVIAMILTALTAISIAIYLDRKSRNLRIRNKYIEFHNEYRLFVWFVIFYIAIFDGLGAFAFSESVFSSKSVLDNASFVKWPINFKLLSGFLIGYFFARLKNEFYLHLFVSILFSFFFAERLHLMEFVISVFVGYLCANDIKISFQKMFNISAIFITIFMAFEATRNFYVMYFVKGSGITFKDAIYNLFERFAAYYGDTTNKFALVISNPEVDYFPFHYLYWFKKQITKDESWFSGTSVGALADSSNASYENLTNIGSFALLYSDFGVFSLILCVIFGVIPSYLFLRFNSSPSLLMGVLLIIFVINALEFSRIFYIFNLRSWMSIVPILIYSFLRQVRRES
jgi:hypothetical protein